MPGYKLLKVFDCQDMPDGVRDAFFGYHEKGNDIYISHYVGEDYPDNYKPVDDWLKENGAVDGEAVLINHWW
jgi:hypothetical protein